MIRRQLQNEIEGYLFKGNGSAKPKHRIGNHWLLIIYESQRFQNIGITIKLIAENLTWTHQNQTGF